MDASHEQRSRSMASVLGSAATVLDELAAVDLDGLDDAALNAAMVALQRLRGRLDAAEARVLARWDKRRCWQASGAKTGAAWLAWQERLPIAEARRRLRHARAMGLFPEIESAWAAGEIDRSHLTAMLGVRTARTTAAFERDHKELLDSARTRGFVDFKRHCDIWGQLADPDGAEQGAQSDRAAREVHLSESFAGMWFGRITLDPISGTIVDSTLRAIEHELFEADWAAAKERLGRDPLGVELDRTPAQRRADALVEMATRARTAPRDGKRPAPLFTVVVGLETLVGPILELFNRTVITPGTAARWLEHADAERIVFDSPSRVIDVGAQRRFFRGALRRAIQIRDRRCFHPSCDEPPARQGEIDHIHEASKGGPTTQINGRWGCDHHNRWRTTHPDDTDLGQPEAGPDPPHQG